MLYKMAEGVGFEPTLGLLLSLISSQVPSTTQPPFQPFIHKPLIIGDSLILQSDIVRKDIISTIKKAFVANAVCKFLSLCATGHPFFTIRG